MLNNRIFDNLVKVSPAQIELYFRHQSSDFDNKREIELLAGCVLSKCFERLDSYSHEILIPIKLRTTEPPSLEEIINNVALHLDSDIDLYLRNNDTSAFKVQVTELEKHYSGKDIDEGLLNLIKRKSKRSPDPDLLLAVIANVNGAGDFEKVRDGLKQINIPFVNIFLLGRFGVNIEHGRFSCRMLYPQLREPIDVNLDI